MDPTRALEMLLSNPEPLIRGWARIRPKVLSALEDMDRIRAQAGEVSSFPPPPGAHGGEWEAQKRRTAQMLEELEQGAEFLDRTIPQAEEAIAHIRGYGQPIDQVDGLDGTAGLGFAPLVGAAVWSVVMAIIGLAAVYIAGRAFLAWVEYLRERLDAQRKGEIPPERPIVEQVTKGIDAMSGLFKAAAIAGGVLTLYQFGSLVLEAYGEE